MSIEGNDNYNDEEYHFAVEPDSGDSNEEEVAPSQSTEKTSQSKFDFLNNFDVSKVKEYLSENIPVRNAIYAVVAVILLIVIYNITSNLLANKKSKTTKNTTNTQSIKKKQQKAQQLPATYQQPTNFSDAEQNKLVSQSKSLQNKVSQVQRAQDTINSRVSNLSSDTFKLTTEYQEINEKLIKLAEQVEKLSSAVEDQSHTIMVMGERQRRQPRPSHIDHPIKRKTYMKYDVQAVIPGRAWLIGQNGSTLTVRKGSIIPGYGVVTLVDVAQGRVLTNSGRIIKFAHNDS